MASKKHKAEDRFVTQEIEIDDKLKQAQKEAQAAMAKLRQRQESR